MILQSQTDVMIEKRAVTMLPRAGVGRSRAGMVSGEVVTHSEEPFSSTNTTVPFPAFASRAAALGLTPRETQVMLVILSGRTSDAEIAAALGITRNTARHHMEHIFETLDVECRTQAVLRLFGMY
jgi:DNA-binding CsgD family transcriptional regulator